jgi:hypothetical protein
MDLWKYIRELYEEKRRLDKLIGSLEEMAAHDQRGGPSRRKRGRKPGMTGEERKKISLRMKRYWAERRASGDGNPSTA